MREFVKDAAALAAVSLFVAGIMGWATIGADFVCAARAVLP